MRYDVRHRTSYRYLQDVSYSCHLAHLLPRATDSQSVEQAEIALSQPAARRRRMADYFGNVVEWFAIDQPHAVLEVISQSRVIVTPARPFGPTGSAAWERVKGALADTAPSDGCDAVQYTFDSPLTASSSAIAIYAAQSFPAGRAIVDGALDLMHRIHADFRYDTTVTDAATPVHRVFEIRSGVCQDLAHAAIACLRALGLAGRYVSGYLLTKPSPGQPRLLGADASHAWFSVWAPPFGWVDLDPTNDVRVSDGHVTLAWGRDYGDVAPLNGVITGGSEHVVEVGVDVIPA
ncbi:MAG: transglutaminase family protein [Rhizomicrobium sp.]